MEDKLQALKVRLGEVSDLRKSASLLGWDQQTFMPPGGATARAEQLATVQKTSHDWFTADEVGELLEALSSESAGWDYDMDEAALVRVTARDYEKARKVPSQLVAEFARVTALAYEAWTKARAQSKEATPEHGPARCAERLGHQLEAPVAGGSGSPFGVNRLNSRAG